MRKETKGRWKNPYIGYWLLLGRAVADAMRPGDLLRLSNLVKRLGINPQQLADDIDWAAHFDWREMTYSADT